MHCVAVAHGVAAAAAAHSAVRAVITQITTQPLRAARWTPPPTAAPMILTLGANQLHYQTLLIARTAPHCTAGVLRGGQRFVHGSCPMRVARRPPPVQPQPPEHGLPTNARAPATSGASEPVRRSLAPSACLSPIPPAFASPDRCMPALQREWEWAEAGAGVRENEPDWERA